MNGKTNIQLGEGDMALLERLRLRLGAPSAEDALHRLLAPPDRTETEDFLEIKKALSLAAPGVDIRIRSRRDEDVTCRMIAAEYLRDKGHTMDAIGAMMNKDHSSVSLYLAKVRDAHRHPVIYSDFHRMRRAVYDKLRMLEIIND